MVSLLLFNTIQEVVPSAAGFTLMQLLLRYGGEVLDARLHAMRIQLAESERLNRDFENARLLSPEPEGVSLRSIGRSLGGSARPIGTSTRLRESLLPAAQPPEIPSADVRLTKLIGKGGMGKVYLGDWRGTPVAVKVLKKRREREMEELAFLRETSVLASLRHPCVCAFFGTLLLPAKEDSDGRRPAELRLALVMEFLQAALYDRQMTLYTRL